MNTTSSDPDFIPVPEGAVELHSAYRAAVSVALTLQRALHLPPEQRAVLERQERREFHEWRRIVDK